MKFDRHFSSYHDDDRSSYEDIDDEEQIPIMKIRKGGRAGKSKLYHFFSHPAVVWSILSTIHLVLLVPSILSLVMTRYTYDMTFWLRNHMVGSLTFIASLYWLGLIIFACYDLYLRAHPKGSFDASASITMVYGCRGVHPRIILTIFLGISTGLLLTPVLVNVDLNRQLTDGVVSHAFGPISPDAAKNVRDVGFNPGLYMLPGDFSPYGWQCDPVSPTVTYTFKSNISKPTHPDGNWPTGFNNDGVRPWTDDLSMDVYLPQNNTNKLPIIFYLHGGQFRTGDKSDTNLVIDYWLQKGFAFISPQYSLLSYGYNVMDAINDVTAAYKFVNSHHDLSTHLNTSQWYFVGEDVGGYLAAATSYKLNDPRIRGVINFFGITEWEFFNNTYPTLTPMATILEFARGSETLANVTATSFMQTHVPPTLSMHGLSDSVVPSPVSTEFHRKLSLQNHTNLLVEFQAYDHGIVGSFYAHANQMAYYAMEHFFAATGILLR
eukprot:TRINITY_DN11338_c0_g1_i1.p1 TRINITY_DN11338_c0_g1~~TRINITY_DN11338_c0_g1_i1.p1  ORF type:complete len:491 (-),score=66.06 TRINITY_DN11338_c0_g1_i1:25-1497(-)